MSVTPYENCSPVRVDRAKAGLHALAHADEALAPGILGWVIRVTPEGARVGAEIPCYPTQVYGGITLTHSALLAMRFSSEGDAREAGYLLRDDEDMFDMFEAVVAC
jgi:hypothetical protein